MMNYLLFVMKKKVISNIRNNWAYRPFLVSLLILLILISLKMYIGIYNIEDSIGLEGQLASTNVFYLNPFSNVIVTFLLAMALFFTIFFLGIIISYWIFSE